jgi:hypothetical protein
MTRDIKLIMSLSMVFALIKVNMGFINNLLHSFKKSKKLRQISIDLSKPTDYTNLSSLMASSKNDPIEKLIELCLSDELNVELLEKYGVDNNTLKEIYDKLTLNGAGQYVKGHLVSASSIIYPTTLTFLLHHFKNGEFQVNDWDDYNSTLFITDRLLRYFKTNKLKELTYD